MKNKLIIAGMAVALLFAEDTLSQDVELKNGKDSLSYSFGLLYARNLELQGIDDLDREAFYSGFNTYYGEGSVLMTDEQANLIIQEYFDSQMSVMQEENLKKGIAFMEENAAVEGVVELPSGLQYKVIEEGSGRSPGLNDLVTVHYRGALLDGTVFDSSFDRGEPVQFRLNQVIRGWQEGLQLMNEGSRWMLYIPPKLGYGERGTGDVIGPNETLVFEVELISVED